MTYKPREIAPVIKEALQDMPVVVITGMRFRGYEQTYLERDIRDLSQIGNIISFRNLLHLCELRTGRLSTVLS